MRRCARSGVGLHPSASRTFLRNRLRFDCHGSTGMPLAHGTAFGVNPAGKIRKCPRRRRRARPTDLLEQLLPETGAGTPPHRGHALCRAGAGQAPAPLSGDRKRAALRRPARPVLWRSARPLNACIAIRWSMTIFPPWTMTICAAAVRRSHRAFDEATAILAGDALLTFAFEILSRPDIHPDPAMRLDLARRTRPRRRQGRHGRRPDARP